MAQLRLSFLQSQTLWEQMHYLERKGTMHLVRDYNLIFHGCVPVDDDGGFLPMHVDGVEYRGKALFDALDHVDPPRVPRTRSSGISTCSGTCGAGRSRRCSARTRSRRSRVTSSPTRRRTRRRRTRTSS